MDETRDALAYLVQVLDSMGVPYMVGGSVALGVWSIPRMTHDLDVVIDLPGNRVREFCARFPADRFYIDSAAMEQAFRQANSPSLGMYSFIDMTSGLKIDLFPLRPNDAAQATAFTHRVMADVLEGQPASVCTAADMLIQKLRWYSMGESQRQFQDCVNLLLADAERTAPQIDPAYVEGWVQKLGPKVRQTWELVRQAAAKSQPPTQPDTPLA